MNSTLLTIRAVGAEFANRLWFRSMILATVVMVLLVALVVWLQASVSTWWILLGFPVVILISVAIGVLFITKQIIRTVSPIKTKGQRTATKQFVDKLQAVSDTISTPKFIILFHVLRDIVSPRKNGYVDTVITNSTALTSDFKKLSKLF